MYVLRTLLAVATIGGVGLTAPTATATTTATATATVTTAATVVQETQVDARTLDLQISSPAMGGNQGVRLLLPPGWSKQATRTWPVLYLLHGAGDDYTAWTAKTDVEELTANTPAIIVMPNGGKCGNYSNWWNQGNFGPPGWETFHLTELRQILESDYRAGTQRAIAGLSMGGNGAMSYAARNPGMFRAAASYSGAVHTLIDRPSYPDGPDVTKLMPLTCPELDWRNLWGDPAIPAQRLIWQQHNPYDLAGQLAGVGLFVSGGNGKSGPFDAPSIFDDITEKVTLDMSVAFVNQLGTLGVPVVTDFYGNGRHAWPYWERELHRSFPMLMASIGAV